MRLIACLLTLLAVAAPVPHAFAQFETATVVGTVRDSSAAVVAGARQRVDVAMAVGQLTEKVEVRASAVQLQTDSSDRSQIISGEMTRALPLNGREYSQLALLSPGVRLSALNTGGFTPREGSFNSPRPTRSPSSRWSPTT